MPLTDANPSDAALEEGLFEIWGLVFLVDKVSVRFARSRVKTAAKGVPVTGCPHLPSSNPTMGSETHSKRAVSKHEAAHGIWPFNLEWSGACWWCGSPCRPPPPLSIQRGLWEQAPTQSNLEPPLRAASSRLASNLAPDPYLPRNSIQ